MHAHRTKELIKKNSQSNHMHILLQSCSQGFLESKITRSLENW